MSTHRSVRHREAQCGQPSLCCQANTDCSQQRYRSGRQPHNIPHIHNNIQVGGSWNNYEGVGLNGTGGEIDPYFIRIFVTTGLLVGL
jgi:hypothetical protein